MTEHGVTEKRIKPQQWILLGLAAVVLLALLTSRDLIEQSLQPDSVLLPPLPCDLHQGNCIASRGNQLLQLSLTPRPLESSQPISIEVRLQHLDARQVMLDLQGVEMYMGLNQTQLTQDPERPEIWRGTTELAVCTTGEMTWRASVYVDTAEQLYSTAFDFDAR
ncbi:hypothetical protein ADINL_2190 [Nitrincola lacisaponensis]|uniref:Uncharacterized protein n=1 Tax=Nitrincola lacisaponensis TaxID=267850 RepID=A0A063Y2R9_9GAMM|nr:hypothetical protein [Nitrincola lacisaponensis]KDE39061.1 hypothetical protein ADINL_2190 [Nitrincola lacisaponensis]